MLMLMQTGQQRFGTAAGNERNAANGCRFRAEDLGFIQAEYGRQMPCNAPLCCLEVAID